MRARQFLASGLVIFAAVLASPAAGQEILPPDNDAPDRHPQSTYGPTDLSMMNPPHLVLQAPRPIKPKHGHVEQSVVDDESGMTTHEPTSPRFHEDVQEKVSKHFLHADKMSRPPAIPTANRMPVWKTPYSYGHFGATRNRQWSFHNGYQQTYTQWTLR